MALVTFTVQEKKKIEELRDFFGQYLNTYIVTRATIFVNTQCSGGHLNL